MSVELKNQKTEGILFKKQFCKQKTVLFTTKYKGILIHVYYINFLFLFLHVRPLLRLFVTCSSDLMYGLSHSNVCFNGIVVAIYFLFKLFDSNNLLLFVSLSNVVGP